MYKIQNDIVYIRKESYVKAATNVHKGLEAATNCV